VSHSAAELLPNTIVITGTPHLASIVMLADVCRRLLSVTLPAGGWAGRPPGGRATDTSRRASRVTSS